MARRIGSLIDEGRRKELREAVKEGRPIVFRKMMLQAEEMRPDMIGEDMGAFEHMIGISSDYVDSIGPMWCDNKKISLTPRSKEDDKTIVNISIEPD